MCTFIICLDNMTHVYNFILIRYESQWEHTNVELYINVYYK